MTDPLDPNSKPDKTLVNLFTGPNPGQGLDLDGTFLYAFNAAAEEEPGQIRDAYFTTDTWPGVLLEAAHVANGWNQGVNFGDSADEQALSWLMSSIRWSSATHATTPDITKDSPGTHSEPNLDRVLDIPINLSLELGHTRMSIRDLLRLSQGSVVKLDRPGGDPLDILVNGCLVARGEVVVINERFGVRITDIVSPEERIRRLR